MSYIDFICKKGLSAFSLIETIVASVIFMIIFIIAMHTLTNIVKYDITDTSYLIMENELQKLRKSIVLDNSFPVEQEYVYEWGDIKIHITPYRNNVYQVELTAVSKKKNKTINYRFLQATP